MISYRRIVVWFRCIVVEDSSSRSDDVDLRTVQQKNGKPLQQFGTWLKISLVQTSIYFIFTMGGSVFLETVVPALGAFVSMLMYGAPLSAVLKASANKTLGVSFIGSLAVLDIFQIFLRRCKWKFSTRI